MFNESGYIVYQNDAVDVSFPKKVVTRSSEVKNGSVICSEKIDFFSKVWVQISNFESFRVRFRNSLKVGIVYQNDALDVSISNKGTTRSPEVKNAKGRISDFYEIR